MNIEPIFNGLPGESLQAFTNRRVAEFKRFTDNNPDWSPPALNRERDRYDSWKV